MKLKQWLLLGSGVALLLVVAIASKDWGLFSVLSKANTEESAISLSVVVLLGLALVVVLMAALAIVYSVLDLTDKTQALALPEGSVRALIAFSLVLVFVLLGAFLYRNVSDLGPGTTIARVPKTDVDDLKKDFVVIAEPATKADGSPETETDGKTPLYNATYFVRHNKDTDDFAKQIFTTLATVFVSVISFYFGSSAATSGAGAMAKAMLDGGKKKTPGISKLEPDKITAGSGDTRLNIVGDRLAGVAKVKFDKLEVKPDRTSDKMVTVVAPQSVLVEKATVKVSVVSDDGESPSLDLFVV